MADVACRFSEHNRVGNVLGLGEVRQLDPVEQIPVRRLPAEGFGGLAGESRGPAVRVVETGVAHGLDIDQVWPVADLATCGPVPENGLAGLIGRSPALSHLPAARLQDEAAMADIEIELAGEAAHP